MSITIGNELSVNRSNDTVSRALRENSTSEMALENRTDSDPSPTAAYEFARAALAREGVRGAASGIFDGQLYIWLFLDELDVAETKALFDLQATFERRHQGTFEVHVDALQGRALFDALPRSFQLLSHR